MNTMKSKEDTLSILEVKEAIDAWEKLTAKAEEILSANHTYSDGITSIWLDHYGKTVGIAYWTTCRGESYIDDAIVPVKWFGVKSKEDLEELWRKKHNAALRAERRAAKRAEKRRAELKKTAAERKKKKELATLKRLKAKYPEEA